MLHKVKPAALASRRASVFVDWQVSGAEVTPSQVSLQAIRADMSAMLAAAPDLFGNPAMPRLLFRLDRQTFLLWRTFYKSQALSFRLPL